MGAAEFELGQLRLKILEVEATLAASRPIAAPLAVPAIAPVPTVAIERPQAAPVETPAEPPLLPPIRQPSPVPAPTPDVESTWSRLRAALQQFQLWPPSGESNTEVRLGAWWATRIGALLAVIGVVFFGIYVSLATPPWVKLAELLAVVGGVGALGLWLERRLPKFGAVVFGGALALMYFSAYAAYAVPATRVLDQAWQGVAAQLVAVGAVFAAAQWRRSASVATMAVALGYVAAWFSFATGLGGLALSMALVLAAGAVALRLVHGWAAPVAVALPLAYAVYARFAVVAWSRTTGDTVEQAWLWLMGFGMVFFWSDWWPGRSARELVDGRGRALQSINASLAIALGLVVTLRLNQGSLSIFYVGAALLCGLGAWAWRGREGSAALVALLACKAAGLLGLAVIAEFSGHVRALVLLTQAFALLVTARSSAIKALRVSATVVWGTALLFFLGQAVGDAGQWGRATVVAAVAFVGGAAWWLGWNERWLAASHRLKSRGRHRTRRGGGRRYEIFWEMQAGGRRSACFECSRGQWRSDQPRLDGTGRGGSGRAARCTRGNGELRILRPSGVEALDQRGRFARCDFVDRDGVGSAWCGGSGRRCPAMDPCTGGIGDGRVAGVTSDLVLGAQPAAGAGGGDGHRGSADGVCEMGGAVAAGGLEHLGVGLGLDWVWSGELVDGSGREQYGWPWRHWFLDAGCVTFAASRSRREGMLDAVWRELTPTVQTFLATLVTLIALQSGLAGIERVVGCAMVGLAVAALAWRPGGEAGTCRGVGAVRGGDCSGGWFRPRRGPGGNRGRGIAGGGDGNVAGIGEASGWGGLGNVASVGRVGASGVGLVAADWNLHPSVGRARALCDRVVRWSGDCALPAGVVRARASRPSGGPGWLGVVCAPGVFGRYRFHRLSHRSLRGARGGAALGWVFLPSLPASHHGRDAGVEEGPDEKL